MVASEGWDTGYRRASYILIQMAFDGSLESSALALQCGKKSALRNPNFDSLSATQSSSLNFCLALWHFLTSQP